MANVYVFAMDTDPSYVSTRSLMFAYGYHYVQQLRDDDTHSISLPKKQFEAAYYADLLPTDIQRTIKELLGTGALQSRWAQSYTVQSCLKVPDYDAKKEMNLASSKDGLLASANDAIILWNPKKSTVPLCMFAFEHPLEAYQWRHAIAFIGENRIAEGVGNEMRVWDTEKQIRRSTLSIEGMSSIAHIVSNGKGLICAARIHEKPKSSGGFRRMVATYKLVVIMWSLNTNEHKETAYHANALALSDDGNILAVGQSSGGVELIDLTQWKSIAIYNGCGYAFGIDSLVFMTPTIVASASSDKGSLILYDYATTKRSSYGMSGRVLDIKRINNTTLAILAGEYPQTITIKIFNTTRGYVHSIPVSCKNKEAFTTVGNTIAVGSPDGTIMLYRPRLLEIPENNDSIPFAAYAFAAMDDTYEDNCIDDPDYSDDNV